MSWSPIDPYAGPAEIEPLTGEDLVELVAYYKRTADQNGEPHDPEWDRWLVAAGLGEITDQRTRQIEALRRLRLQ